MTHSCVLYVMAPAMLCPQWCANVCCALLRMSKLPVAATWKGADLNVDTWAASESLRWSSAHTSHTGSNRPSVASGHADSNGTARMQVTPPAISIVLQQPSPSAAAQR
eukprot:TRINITY_DN15187_c0_g1_i1.p1 TRINITY_DN15187_c0_g1~~TRINITY_DN15187_c0_g1_i1.p1  ORF type:complete len:108 (+),score=18.39 TRINITY_DN15187_c0_g1_i1:163-486(+)